MKVERLHSWQVSVTQALDIQMKLAAKISKVSEVNTPHFIAGVDISATKAQGEATGAVVILSYPELKLVETKKANGKLVFPYIPGLLSFRESPLILAACEKLTVIPDLILVDGQGVAHPRRMGLASHLGLLLNTPTIGCAKSRLCGSHNVLGVEPGSYAELIDNGEIIGAALRTKLGVSPVYVSVGHKVDLPTAIHWVLACCRGHRLPEPTRLAHLVASGNLDEERTALISEAAFQERLFT
ncbi:MAG: deoxyribonuclease V [Dehalococcoidales bacterium]